MTETELVWGMSSLGWTYFIISIPLLLGLIVFALYHRFYRPHRHDHK